VLAAAYRYSRAALPAQYPATAGTLQWTLNGTEFGIPVMPINAWVYSDSGDLTILSRIVNGKSEVWRVTRRSLAGTTVDFMLPPLPELQQGVGQVMPDIAVDSFGVMYIPIVWRYTKENQGVGVVALHKEGSLDRLIVLKQRVEIRHVAVDANGSLYVLGVDPAYFNRRIDDCYILHKYTAQGERIASFSTCPRTARLRQPGSIVPGPGIDELMHETQRGSIWLKGDSVFQLLPYAHELRQFSLNGTLQNRLVLDLPPQGQSGDIPVQIFPRTDGTFVVIWLHKEIAELNTIGSGKYMALHDAASGRALTIGTPVLATSGIPFFSDKGGRLFALARGDNRYEVKRADVSVQ
jgi:hypothetical protein